MLVRAHGHGTFTYLNGNKYVGEYRLGKKHGKGTYTFSDGIKYVGEWRENKPLNGKEYDKDGNITVVCYWSESVMKQSTATVPARGQNFCANFVPLAYKNRPYLGKCGNSEDQLSY